MRKTLLILLALTLGHTMAQAAVSAVTFKLAYNPSTCLYNVYMTVTGGSTTSIQEQEAYTAQVSIVVPTGTVVGATIVSNEPKTGSISNNVLTRTTAKTWSNSNFDINNSVLPGYDVYAFTPALTNAYYPALNNGDSVLLFSLSIGTTSCGSGVRLWNNNEIQGSPATGGDPTSTAFGGTDYNNGHDFSSSTVYQAYVGNGTSYVTPPSPTLTLTPTYTPGTSFADTSAAAPGSSCASGLTYAWTGPNSFASTSPSIYVSPLTASSYGTYTLVVTDAKGCTATASSTISVPLPIHLISFDGMGVKCAAFLNWKAITDGELDHFDVQSSTNGVNYETVGQVPAQANAAEGSYSFTVNQEDHKTYYRLKMVEQSGNISYSQVIPVSTECERREITVSPNPAATDLTIGGLNVGDKIKVINSIGQTMLLTTASENPMVIDIHAYTPGLYNVLVVRDNEVKKAVSIIKQ